MEAAITTSGQSGSLLITADDAEEVASGNADGAIQINAALQLVNALASSLNVDVYTEVDDSTSSSDSSSSSSGSSSSGSDGGTALERAR